MQPIGPLMIEHRLIERAVPLMQQEVKRLTSQKNVNKESILTIVDFFRTYADRCHHGKEEDILFKALKKRKISAEHKRIMEELMVEHVNGRETVGKLLKAKTVLETAAELDKLIKLYPEHIAKEDKKFFIPVMVYFNEQEQKEMLEQMQQFDQQLIHEKYKKVIENLGKADK